METQLKVKKFNRYENGIVLDEVHRNLKTASDKLLNQNEYETSATNLNLITHPIRLLHLLCITDNVTSINFKYTSENVIQLERYL